MKYQENIDLRNYSMVQNHIKWLTWERQDCAMNINAKKNTMLQRYNDVYRKPMNDHRKIERRRQTRFSYEGIQSRKIQRKAKNYSWRELQVCWLGWALACVRAGTRAMVASSHWSYCTKALELEEPASTSKSGVELQRGWKRKSLSEWRHRAACSRCG